VYKYAIEWASEYDNELYEMLSKNQEYSMKVLQIERENEKPRKDIAKWSDLKENIAYMYDEEFEKVKGNYELQKITDKEKIKQILNTYAEKYFDLGDDKQTWFDKLKDLAEEFGYAREVKEYKENPDNYKGHVGDVSSVIRIAVTTKAMTPNLYDILKLFGKERIQNRIKELEKNI
jgi:glutamyl-tRNA synthetase